MFTEKRHTAEFLLSELNGSFSRDVGLIARAPHVLDAGTVLSLVDGKYVITTEALEANAILYARTDPTAGDVRATIITRCAQLIKDALTFGPDIITEAQRHEKYLQLARTYLIVY